MKEEANRLKVEIDRVNTLLQRSEQQFRSLAMQVPFEHGDMSFERVGGYFRLKWKGRPVMQVKAEEKLNAAAFLPEFGEKYVAELNRLTQKARDV